MQCEVVGGLVGFVLGLLYLFTMACAYSMCVIRSHAYSNTKSNANEPPRRKQPALPTDAIRPSSRSFRILDERGAQASTPFGGTNGTPAQGASNGTGICGKQEKRGVASECLRRTGQEESGSSL